jgi:hypothetical protein
MRRTSRKRRSWPRRARGGVRRALSRGIHDNRAPERSATARHALRALRRLRRGKRRQQLLRRSRAECSRLSRRRNPYRHRPVAWHDPARQAPALQPLLRGHLRPYPQPPVCVHLRCRVVLKRRSRCVRAALKRVCGRAGAEIPVRQEEHVPNSRGHGTPVWLLYALAAAGLPLRPLIWTTPH